MGEERGGLSVSIYDTMGNSASAKSSEPSKRQFSASVVSISTPTGLIEILPGHQPFITAVTTDGITFSGPDGNHTFRVDAGFVASEPLAPNRITLVGHPVREERAAS
jgi:hypothetical protein